MLWSPDTHVPCYFSSLQLPLGWILPDPGPWKGTKKKNGKKQILQEITSPSPAHRAQLSDQKGKNIEGGNLSLHKPPPSCCQPDCLSPNCLLFPSGKPLAWSNTLIVCSRTATLGKELTVQRKGLWAEKKMRRMVQRAIQCRGNSKMLIACSLLSYKSWQYGFQWLDVTEEIFQELKSCSLYGFWNVNLGVHKVLKGAFWRLNKIAPRFWAMTCLH